MKIIYSAQARCDLDDIRRWIMADNPLRALSFVQELRARIAGLKDQPRRFPLMNEHQYPDVHRMVHRGYRILYRITDASILVLYVHHGRRATPAL